MANLEKLYKSATVIIGIMAVIIVLMAVLIQLKRNENACLAVKNAPIRAMGNDNGGHESIREKQ